MGGRKRLTQAQSFRSGLPDRQVIYRCRGEVRYFNFGWKSQSAVALAVLVLFGWLGYSSLQLALMDDRLQGERERSEALARSNASLAQRYAIAQDRVGEVAIKLERVEAALDQAMVHRRDLQYEIARLHGELVETDMARQQNLGLLEHARTSKAHVENEIVELLSRQAEIIRRARVQTDGEYLALHGSLSITGLNVDRLVEKALKTTQNEGIGGPYLVEDGTSPIFLAPPAFSTPPAFSALAPMPTSSLYGEPTGLLRAALTRSDSMHAGAFGQGVLELDERYARLDALRSLLRNLPLVRPVDTGRFTSGFGHRKDPFTGRRAFHSGLDFSDARGTPILATAPGTIIFAGRRPGYGNTVEIDHGFDIMTRYAHLDRILVTRGDDVDFRDKIGTMGSTGRSTGIHLHYEILHQGNALNPMNFIRAGRDVFRQSKKQLQEISHREGDGPAVPDLERADDNR